MRARRPLLIPLATLAALLLSCPRAEDPTPLVTPAAVAPAAAAAIAPPPPAPPQADAPPAPAASETPAACEAPASADTPAGADALLDPAALALPPELVDDGSDDLPEPEPAPAEAPAPAPAREPDELASIARETWIFAEPRWGSRRLGYLRAGAVVTRRPAPSGWGGCAEGWYRIEPRGYVCVGATATLDVHDLAVAASARRPVRAAVAGADPEDPRAAALGGLPYTYALSRFPPPPLYARLPEEDDQRSAEPDLASHLRKIAAAARLPDFTPPPPADPTPPVLLYGRPAPALGGAVRSPDALLAGRARTRSGFALLSTFDHDGRRFGLTTDLAVLPIDRTRVVRPSTFSGLRLDGDRTLPVAFVRRRHAARWLPGEGGGVARGEALGFREAVPLSEGSRRIGGALYLEARDGALVRADEVVRVDPLQNAPAWATGDRKWIDVSILRQSLVAYEGARPVYVTLVSTGADGIGDPKTTRSTIQGAFLIHTKHVSVTMDGDEEDDGFDFRDVPFVQYFTEGFALHAAYWHDEFGTPRSHGCVNLAPMDAAWLFEWTTPEVPAAWHAALSLKKGTLVHVHP